MGQKNPAVDAYIDAAAPYARPILKKLRSLFHKGCPQVEEKIKWGMPSFEHKGILAGFAAFKNHVSWGFWKAALIKDPNGVMQSDASSPMGGGRPKSVDELPPDEQLLDFIRQAVELNEKGVKLPSRSRPKAKTQAKPPADLAAALKKNLKAKAVFDAFSPSHKREYIEWITEAKAAETRQRRLVQAIEWMAEGKPRNWKYMRR